MCRSTRTSTGTTNACRMCARPSNGPGTMTTSACGVRTWACARAAEAAVEDAAARACVRAAAIMTGSAETRLASARAWTAPTR